MGNYKGRFYLPYQRVQVREKSSKYKGVYWSKSKKKWQAYIKKNNKRYHIGTFTEEDEAGLAYNRKALELFGEFACLNKVI
ncbi:MAG: AP2 domain-containing protein [Candidatus Hodarchaeota archaeon]